ncbi:hypothetical protein EDB81DRAFT_854407 [Dactylonectria macrodidyma]|uniref:Uncharacterized protein n=1 Tax=Dactylonectria macrodidyma TaxID=307937 RepID=A0A9P9F9J2_9HYPO|nr:hypothetical protein EDB81DRAFT_854407 [Dactylonectria macrodidyma]
MTGQAVYTVEQIRFILGMLIEEKKGPVISEAYNARFGKGLTPNQLRYVKNKYGKDSDYGTVLINSALNKNNRKRKQGDDRAVRDNNCSVEANRGVNKANNPFANHPFAGIEGNGSSGVHWPTAGPEENQSTNVPQTPYSRLGEGQAEEGFGVDSTVTSHGVTPGPHNMGWNGSQYPEPTAQFLAQVPVQPQPGPERHHPILYPNLNQQQSTVCPEVSSLQNYHTQPTPKVETPQFTFSLPANAPVYEGQPTQHQQQAQAPNRIYQTHLAWANNNQDLLSFGGIPNVPTQSAGAQTSYTAPINQLPAHGTRSAQSNVPMVSPSQTVASKQLTTTQAAQQGHITQSVQHYNQYAANQPGDLLSPPNEVSPANFQTALTNYYPAAQQHGQTDESQKRQHVAVQQVAVEQQTNQVQDWNVLVSPELYSTPQPRQVDDNQTRQQELQQQLMVQRRANQAPNWNQYATLQPYSTPQQQNNNILLHHGQPYMQQHQGRALTFHATVEQTPDEPVYIISQAPSTPYASTNTAPNHNMVQQASPPFDAESLASASPATAEDITVVQTETTPQEYQGNVESGCFTMAEYAEFLHTEPQDYGIEQQGPHYEKPMTEGIEVCIGDYNKVDPKLMKDMFTVETARPSKREP